MEDTNITEAGISTEYAEQTVNELQVIFQKPVLGKRKMRR